MTRVSAGLLVYRRGPRGPEFLLAHPGGPFWRGKDEAAWSVPKGLVEPGEDLLAAARREFREEIGQSVEEPARALPPVTTRGGKRLYCWLVEADLALEQIHSATFELEWPPRSGHLRSFPEVDQAGYFDLAAARWKAHRGQRPLIDLAAAHLSGEACTPEGKGRPKSD